MKIICSFLEIIEKTPALKNLNPHYSCRLNTYEIEIISYNRLEETNFPIIKV